MQIGYVMLAGSGATDRFLTDLAEVLAGCGHRLAGAVQTNTRPAPRVPARPDDAPCSEHCDMDLNLLPDGPTVRISQSLGRESRGCRLNADQLERAVTVSAARLPAADILIVNKFGKHEAEGRGFRELIGQALGEGKPVIVGVNPQNAESFHQFVGSFAQELPADHRAIADWLALAAAA